MQIDATELFSKDDIDDPYYQDDTGYYDIKIYKP